MSVYFVYRSHYQNPTTLHLKSFPQRDLLQFFRSIWKGISDHGEAHTHAEQLLGRKVYSFSSLFSAIADGDMPPPGDMETAADALEDACYADEMSFGPHHLQLLTDDDELEMALYFFDDAYAKEHPEQTAILLQQDWKLPSAFGAGQFQCAEEISTLGSGNGKGSCYLVALQYSDSGNLTDLDCAAPTKFDKVRLPDLIPLLVQCTPNDNWPWEALVLRSQALAFPEKIKDRERAFLMALRGAPQDVALWSVFSDWLREQTRPVAGLTMLERGLQASAAHPLAVIYNTMRRTTLTAPVQAAEGALVALSNQVRKPWGHDPRKSLIRVDEHIAQLCLHAGHWASAGELYHHWVLFDDLWANANTNLAHSLLRLATRWDVLGDADED